MPFVQSFAMAEEAKRQQHEWVLASGLDEMEAISLLHCVAVGAFGLLPMDAGIVAIKAVSAYDRAGHSLEPALREVEASRRSGSLLTVTGDEIMDHGSAQAVRATAAIAIGNARPGSIPENTDVHDV